MTSRRFIRLPLMAFLTGILAACQQAGQSTDTTESSVQAGPEAKPGLALTNGRLVLPVVEGRPGAAYFKLENNGDAPVTLAGAYIEGATSAEIHETRAGSMARIESLEIGPGQAVLFEPGGLHVMAFELSSRLTARRAEGATEPQTELTLTFSDGDKLSASLAIETMGLVPAGDSH